MANRFIIFLLLAYSINSFACDSPASICNTPGEDRFAIIERSRASQVVIDQDTNSAVAIAAQNFVDDLQRVSGKKSRLKDRLPRKSERVIIIGELGNSPLIDELIKAEKLDISEIKDQWEAYKIAVVNNPWPKIDQALVVVGADRRGTVFGTYTLSEEMGVSPWYWFADVPVTPQKNVYISAGERTDKPAVKYRGIFINDEDPALSGWAKKRYGGVNADMYEPMFELILRLKGNYIWPAMWAKAFHVDDPKSTKLADDMGIVVGTSHHEPLMRAHAEWHKSEDHPHAGGAWNYQTNKSNLQKFWQEGIERMMAKGNGEAYESLVTVGMRGDGDEPMSEGTAIELLENIVADQRKIIADVTEQPAENTPQVWALYKEVQDYFDKGMRVPEDITLLFCDDNWGQIRRLPDQGQKRKGGYGIYYHFDYVGAPRNYKWTNTISLAETWQQMDLAYQQGVETIWIVNVGDLKPIEQPIDFFLAMAWNPEAFNPDNITDFSEQWAAQQFGEKHASEIASLLNQYGQYASMRKPELLNENTFAVGETEGDMLTRSELYEHWEKWQALEQAMLAVKPSISENAQSAFYQLVEFPIASLANLYELYFSAAWNLRLALHHDNRANHFLKRTQKSYERDAELTEKYHSINGGKWDGMMNQVHMNYTIWNTPIQQSMPPVVSVNGGARSNPVNFQDYYKKPDYIRVAASDYSRQSGSSNVAWQAVKYLGRQNSAMITYPQTLASTSVTDNVALEYDISLPAAGNYELTLALSPTLDARGGDGLHIAVAANGAKPTKLKNLLIPTAGAVHTPEQQAWSDAVIDNQHLITTTLKGMNKGKNTIKIWRIDGNIVLESLTLAPSK